MVKVVLCGTHPGQYNGYSKVVYKLADYIGRKCSDIDLYVFGFQNFYDRGDHKIERVLPPNVHVFDAHANESPKNKGFGESLISNYIADIDPDIVIIYNDLIVLNTFLSIIHKDFPNRKFVIYPYIDIVYKNERNSMIKKINELSDGAFVFTQYWKTVLEKQDYKKPMYILEHGYDDNDNYPVPKALARRYFGIDEKDFVILNLNRNQPRKRWDICIMAFIRFIANNPDSNIRMIVATALNSSWDLVDIMISETRKYNLNVEDIKKNLIIIKTPQLLTDFDINVLYNCADVGINTCDGEGFGLCNFEQALVGIPQIAPYIGGLRDFLREQNALIVHPSWSFYCDHARDLVAGEAEVCAVEDYVAMMQYAMENPEKIKELGKQAREDILSNYNWTSKGRAFADALRHISKTHNVGTTTIDTNDPNNITVKPIHIDTVIKNKAQQSGSFTSSEINKSISVLDNVLRNNTNRKQEPPIEDGIQSESYKSFIKKLMDHAKTA